MTKAKRCVFEATEIIVDVVFGEGGRDAKIFVHELMAAYVKYATRLNFSGESLSTEDGHVIVKFSGTGVYKAFQNECGKHCIQRIPPTEHNGRKQTSMVSVMVLPLPPERGTKTIPESELKITTQRGHGKGGQHQNTTDSAVRIVHPKTGLSVFINGRDQHQNKKEALRIITARVNEHYAQLADSQYNEDRKKQWGGGGRGNKIRTYNYLESRCVDHRLGIKTSRVHDVIGKGKFELLMSK